MRISPPPPLYVGGYPRVLSCHVKHYNHHNHHPHRFNLISFIAQWALFLYLRLYLYFNAIRISNRTSAAAAAGIWSGSGSCRGGATLQLMMNDFDFEYLNTYDLDDFDELDQGGMGCDGPSIDIHTRDDAPGVVFYAGGIVIKTRIGAGLGACRRLWS